MKFVLMLFIMLYINHTESYKIDFNKTKGKDWVVLNDVVMGGQSTGTVNVDKKALNFIGNLSLENNGGFASVRSPWQNYDLSNYTKVKIKCNYSAYLNNKNQQN